MNITDGSMKSRKAPLAARIDGVGPGPREMIQQEDGEAAEQGGAFCSVEGHGGTLDGNGLVADSAAY